MDLSFWLIEGIGFLATAFIVASFLSSSITKLRIINLIGCSLFIIYAIIINSFSIVLINTILLFIHIYKLSRKELTVEEKERQAS